MARMRRTERLKREVAQRCEAAAKGGGGEPASVAFAQARTRVDGFVAANFGFAGTLRLHRAALGVDLLRAPLNLVLAPLHALVRLAGLIFRAFGARRAAFWLGRRSLVIPTAVAQEIERRLVADLFGFDGPGEGLRSMESVIEGARPLRGVFRKAPDGTETRRRAVAAANTISVYSGTRSAVAEITVSILVLSLGAVVFHSLTPGVMTFAPNVAERIAQETAISGFWLGETLGRTWYGWFPTGTSSMFLAATMAALMLAAAALTAFAGVIADPIQAALGIHRRRLLRLIDAVEADVTGTGSLTFRTNEHFYARLVDIVDTGAGLLRFLR